MMNFRKEINYQQPPGIPVCPLLYEIPRILVTSSSSVVFVQGIYVFKKAPEENAPVHLDL